MLKTYNILLLIWKNATITLNIYVHSSMELKRAQMERMVQYVNE